MKSGFTAAALFLKSCKYFFRQLGAGDNPFSKQIKLANALLNNKQLDWLDQSIDPDSLSFFKLSSCDHLLRATMKTELQSLMEIIYELDVYITVSKCASDNSYGYAKALPAEKHVFKAEELKHPLLKNAVGNTISMTQDSNMVFLTGANMAGKSTLMKTIGISFFLAHLGFPVAAKNMEFSVKEGLCSSINTPDNLSMGYSHFYAEVMRVKKVAEEVAAGQNMLVIFDELFKGTNVKDAFDATHAVTESFAAYNNCFFIISTHIIEVGEALKAECNNIQFKYLPTILQGTVPRYTYTLNEGITSDRQGMMIIENEGILELLNHTV
jgi:DNA mismatch repair ATPase MutS